MQVYNHVSWAQVSLVKLQWVCIPDSQLCLNNFVRSFILFCKTLKYQEGLQLQKVHSKAQSLGVSGCLHICWYKTPCLCYDQWNAFARTTVFSQEDHCYYAILNNFFQLIQTGLRLCIFPKTKWGLLTFSYIHLKWTGSSTLALGE
jgi:hypothetical protein